MHHWHLLHSASLHVAAGGSAIFRLFLFLEQNSDLRWVQTFGPAWNQGRQRGWLWGGHYCNKQVNKNKNKFVYRVVANTRPPTFSLTQSERGDPLGDGAQVVLRSVKSGTSWEVSLTELRWREVGRGGEVEDASPFTATCSPAAVCVCVCVCVCERERGGCLRNGHSGVMHTRSTEGLYCPHYSTALWQHLATTCMQPLNLHTPTLISVCVCVCVCVHVRVRVCV